MEQVRIGVIGASGRGFLSKSWHEPEGRSVVVGAADISEEALSSFRQHINPDAFVTLDYRRLLDRDDIDAIAVTSPDFTHERYACDAFDAGKHVFTEKPMAISTDGCDRMLRAWVNSGKKFMVGFNMRYMNIFRVMKDAVDSGMIGDIKVVWVRHFVGFGGDWYYHDWHASSKNSTGLLLQKASHDIDMIHWITGRYATRLAAFGSLDYYGGDRPNDHLCTSCDEARTCPEYYNTEDTTKANKMDMCVFRQEVDVEDNSTVLMELEGGLKATYMQCHYTPDYCRNYTFIGTEGRIENIDDSKQVVVKLRDRSNRWRNLADHSLGVKEARGSHGGADPVICRDFVDMLLDGKTPVATPLAGRMSVAAGCAATWSIRHEWQRVEIPPVPEDIRDRVF